MHKEDAVHVHKGTSLSHKQENNNAACNNSGGPGDDHTVGRRLKTDSIYIMFSWNQKMDRYTLIEKTETWIFTKEERWERGKK